MSKTKRTVMLNAALGVESVYHTGQALKDFASLPSLLALGAADSIVRTK